MKPRRCERRIKLFKKFEVYVNFCKKKINCPFIRLYISWKNLTTLYNFVIFKKLDARRVAFKHSSEAPSYFPRPEENEKVRLTKSIEYRFRRDTWTGSFDQK